MAKACVIVQIGDDPLQAWIRFNGREQGQHVGLLIVQRKGFYQGRPGPIARERALRLKGRQAKGRRARVGVEESRLLARGFVRGEQPGDFARGDGEALVGAGPARLPHALHPQS